MIEEEANRIIELALAEDVSQGDATSEALIPPEMPGKAAILVKARGVLAGIEIARAVFLKVDPSLKFEVLVKDGSAIKPGDIVATVTGRVASILGAERVALNFLTRMSGIASLTAQYVAKVRGTDAVIKDTRKTTPGLRSLEKYAVRMGGGKNHRLHLGDAVLIKDNHIAALRGKGTSLKDIVAKARQNARKGLKIEVEVTTVEEAQQAVQARADAILLDNMSPEEMRRIVNLVPKGIETEASGGVNLDNVAAVAATGVNVISVGALTHSPQALDISLELVSSP